MPHNENCAGIGLHLLGYTNIYLLDVNIQGSHYHAISSGIYPIYPILPSVPYYHIDDFGAFDVEPKPFSASLQCGEFSPIIPVHIGTLHS